ncbi:MAG: alpha/beta hydrolase [Desulfuromonadaceae bacterium]|nr:alpha/beta hydrolase [Desulfuromonadaceae bacterium]
MPWYENRVGEQLWYEEQGAGTPVVLIHGWCMSSAVWKYQFKDLPASMHLVAPDLRGHGRSAGISGGQDFGTFATDLIDLLDRLNISKAVLVGWSMGGQIALQVSAGFPGKVAGMVLVSATPRFTAGAGFPYGLAANEAHGMRLKVQRNVKRALEGFHTRLVADGEITDADGAMEIQQLLSTLPLPESSTVVDALDTLVATDMRELLPTVSVPTLIVNGEKDRVCLPEASLYLKLHISGAEQSVYRNCGHMPFMTRSNRFNTELIRFTRRLCEQNA